jgi:endopeptidase La
MNPDNPNIDDLLKTLGKKRGRKDIVIIGSKEVIVEFKILAIKQFEDSFKGKKINNRELSKLLDDYEAVFSATQLFIDDNTIELEKNQKATVMLLLSVQIKLITEIKDEIKNQGRKFNVEMYLKNHREKLEAILEKDQNTNKRAKKMPDDYESDSDAKTSDEEDEKEEEEEGEEGEEGEEDEEEDEEDDKHFRNHKSNLVDKIGKEFIEQLYRGKGSNDLEDETLKYFCNLTNKERKSSLDKLKEINNYQNKDKPVLFQIMSLDLPIEQKNHILKNYLTIATSRYENNKLKQWVDAVMQLPFGKFKGTNLDSIKSDNVKIFLDNLQKSMDDAAWGHDEAKRQIIQMMGQQIRNPKSKGNMLGIWGPPGNGKTTLIKEGIAKAMDKPFVFISLGGASDASFLEGHSYTWEGSIYGRIANGLITSKCMDPIIYFDELDKISKTVKGDEITNILVHLTDPVQNNLFRDKYFHGIDIDLSRATMIFSFNDPSNVNPILLDRITMVETKYLLTSQKIHICKNYLLPTMIKEMGFPENGIVLGDDVIREVINKFTHEGGIRKLKSLMYSIVREINLCNLINSKLNEREVTFPFNIKLEDIKSLLKHKREFEPEKINTKPKCGIVNGLYANSMGTGGVLPIECVWIPAAQSMQIKATGSLEKVIKESTEVAKSVAWNYLEDSVKDKFLDYWKNKPMGFHIHCPDGSTPKDGPSAGGAITVALYSLLTNRKIKHDVAMTGEINLQGRITAIGGLEEKLEGARKSGCTLALVPKENEKDINKIKERNPSLLDDKFNVILIDKFEDIIQHALLYHEPTDTPFLKGFYREDNIENLTL